LIKRQLPKLTEQAKLKEETLEREKLRKTEILDQVCCDQERESLTIIFLVKLLRYVRSDKPRKYEIELTDIFADESAHSSTVSIK
jgi:hypothetical protein